MNERIKQLANIWANRRAEDEKLGIVYTFSEPALEQFAELIIRECVSVINTEAAEHEDDDEIERAWKMGTEFAVYQIKRHFGVEE